MKKLLIALLVCLTAVMLCGCGTVECGYEGCDKQAEETEENESPFKEGSYLCEEHLEEANKLIEDLEKATEDVNKLQ